MDDKVSVISIFEATEQLLKENFQPEQTICLCYGHAEKIAGKRGAEKYLPGLKNNIFTPNWY